FVSAFITGDFVFTARVLSLQSSASSPQAGIMVRENTRRTVREMLISGVPAVAPVLSWRSTTVTTANGDTVDYLLRPDLLTFPPGTSTQNIAVVITDDLIPEPDESVTIILRNAYNARLGSLTQFTLEIIDNDAP